MNSENTYSNPDELVRNNLKHLIGKNITLYTAAGGQSARGFSGILVSVHDDFVKLVNKKRIKHVLYPNPRNPIRKFLFRLKYGCSQRVLHIETRRTNIAVKIDKITAINSTDYSSALVSREKIFKRIARRFGSFLIASLKTALLGKIFFKKPKYFSGVILLQPPGKNIIP